MSKLRNKLALDTSYMNEPADIQLDMVIFPYLERIAQQKSDEIGFPYSDAVIDEIYKDIYENYSLSLDSTLSDIKNTIDAAAQKWQDNMKAQGYNGEQQVQTPQQNVARRV